jgi:hypothetical protein
MPQPFKIAAVCFSLFLLSGYVYLRAGGEAKMFPGSKSAAVVAPSTQPVFVISGSKSAVLTAPGQPVVIGDAAATTQAAGALTLTPQAPGSTPPPPAWNVGPSTTLPVVIPGTNSLTLSGQNVTASDKRTLRPFTATTRPAATTAPSLSHP